MTIPLPLMESSGIKLIVLYGGQSTIRMTAGLLHLYELKGGGPWLRMGNLYGTVNSFSCGIIYTVLTEKR